MSHQFAAIHDELRAVARKALSPASPQHHDGGVGGVDWQLLADAGWLSLEIDESLGGAGATLAEAVIVIEELGRVAAPGPYLGTAVLGVGALRGVEPGPGRDGLLRQVGAGRLLVTVALGAGGPAVGGAATPFSFEQLAGHHLVHGEAAFVPDARSADRLLLLASERGGGRGGGDLALIEVAPDQPGITVKPQPVLDLTRQFGTVVAEGAEVGGAAVHRFVADPVEALHRLGDRAALAVAADSLGLSEAMLAATVAYAGERTQFGQPIGSFQAVKHACADLFVAVSVGRELLVEAVANLVSDAPGAAVAVSMAKSYLSSAAVDVAGKAMQLHGGIGYTWEGSVHAYLKRAILNRALFGSPAAHRRRLARRYGDEPATM